MSATTSLHGGTPNLSIPQGREPRDSSSKQTGNQPEEERQGILRADASLKVGEPDVYSVPALSYSVTLDKSLNFGG